VVGAENEKISVLVIGEQAKIGGNRANQQALGYFCSLVLSYPSTGVIVAND
jgi:regulator of sigma D